MDTSCRMKWNSSSTFSNEQCLHILSLLSMLKNLPRSNSSWWADKRYLPIHCICISEIDFVRYGWSWKLLFKYLYKWHLGELSKKLCASWINQSFSLCFTSCKNRFSLKHSRQSHIYPNPKLLSSCFTNDNQHGKFSEFLRL